MARKQKTETVRRISEGKSWKVITGNVEEVCKTLDETSFDAVLCDPPYGLSFMGKAWDYQVPSASLWAEVLRVLKPGAPCIAFSGTRTYHRTAVAIEDGGFEISDMFSWLYGQGWPKGLDISKAIDKQRHDRDEILKVTGWIKDARDRAGVTNADIDEAFGLNGMSGHWTSQKSQPSVPTLEQVSKLLEVLKVRAEDVPEQVRELLVVLNGRKGEPGDAWKSAQITGYREGVDVRRVPSKASGQMGVAKSFVEKEPSAEAKPWCGYNTQLKPACEPAAFAFRPKEGTYANNVQKWGVGGFNVEASRVGSDLVGWGGGAAGGGTWNETNCGMAKAGDARPVVGRYPSNVMISHLPGCRQVGTKPSRDVSIVTKSTGKVTTQNRAASGPNYGREKLGVIGPPDDAQWECADGCIVPRMDEQSGNRPSGTAVQRNGGGGKFFSGIAPERADTSKARPDSGYSDEGGASRYFHQTQLTMHELEEYARAYERFFFSSKVSTTERGSRNDHPTVKPIGLMQYLARLVMPPKPGRILVPFCGSGSEMLGCLMAGWPEVVGIELDPRMADVARWRIEHATVRQTVVKVSG